ncbi:uncharacterized protein KGF55_003499 [Candida pseudojiufengensis]|uniref:uncharacterized protein n=1 Tax=Candida pseudojiufengensis TaxID=497109 RepID=UPI00222441F6|nr:uncharacterized protein KGF55_003499 [Candida pseudojiufengensis]KAI5962423.1 hypothetical protein KGF55_003499 [Candida pseudojiufengensis]
MSRFIKPLQEFLTSKKDFSIVYSSNSVGSLITNQTERICVLDSSFNPPHLAHYALIEESLNTKHDNIPIENKSILLLLSVKNADKIHPQPESFDKRLEMMYFMANHLTKNYPINVSIGITNHAKFVDKSLSILNFLESQKITIHTGFKLTFLIGFDTLIRIFDPRYYLPDKLSNSLDHFMKMTDLFCLTRPTDEINVLQQPNYVKEIASGKHEEIPSSWSNSIFLLKDLNEKLAQISSSSIRKSIINGDNKDWELQVIPEIRDYIIENKLYQTK